MCFAAREVRRNMRFSAREVRRDMGRPSRSMKTKKTKTKKTKATKKTTRCIAALEWLAHSPPQVRELILVYTNNALSRQYRPPSAEATFFGTVFRLLHWALVSKAFLKKVFSGLDDDDDANDACFTCGCRKRELKRVDLGVLQLQLHRSGVLTLSKCESRHSQHQTCKILNQANNAKLVQGSNGQSKP